MMDGSDCALMGDLLEVIVRICRTNVNPIRIENKSNRVRDACVKMQNKHMYRFKNLTNGVI